MTFSSQLQTRKAQLQLSSRALADTTGLPQSHISTILTGKKAAQTGTLTVLADALDARWMLIPKHLLPEVERLLSGKPIGPDDVPSTMEALFRKDAS